MDVVQERDGSNVVRANLTRVGNIGGLLARQTYTSAGALDKTAFYSYDGSGNVAQITDAAQNVQSAYLYDAFGQSQLVQENAGYSQPYRYSTKWLHAQSGLYDYGFRFYNAGLGRWINRDPIGESGGNNLYGMVGNSPINAVDERGLLIGGADYIAIGGGNNFGIAGFNVQVVYDKYGQVYLGAGPTIGTPGPSGSAVLGYILAPTPTAASSSGFISGPSINVSVGVPIGSLPVGPGGGVTVANNGGVLQGALEGGIFTPQIGVNGTFSFGPFGPFGGGGAGGGGAGAGAGAGGGGGGGAGGGRGGAGGGGIASNFDGPPC